jgi:hypothetical protein
VKDLGGLVFASFAAVMLYRGVQGLRRGRISWLRGSEEYWMAHRDDDPVSFATGVWLHILCGLMALWATYWIVLR